MKRVLTSGLVVLLVTVFSLNAFAGTYKTLGDLLKEAKKVVKEIGVDCAYRDYYKKAGVVFIDVRSFKEVDRYGHIPNAKLIPRGFLEFAIGRVVPDRGTTIVVYCQTGKRSLLAAKTLKEMGYKNVLSMIGGFRAWGEEGYPITH